MAKLFRKISMPVKIELPQTTEMRPKAPTEGRKQKASKAQGQNFLMKAKSTTLLLVSWLLSMLQ
jgi:hypothetical protein